jgi:hypothetical protein
MAQVVQHLPSKCKTLSSNSSTKKTHNSDHVTSCQSCLQLPIILQLSLPRTFHGFRHQALLITPVSPLIWTPPKCVLSRPNIPSFLCVSRPFFLISFTGPSAWSPASDFYSLWLLSAYALTSSLPLLGRKFLVHSRLG